MAEVGKVLYIVVVDEDEQKGKGKESFRYTRPVLQSTLQLMGCKARHAFKACLLSIQFNCLVNKYKTHLFTAISVSVLVDAEKFYYVVLCFILLESFLFMVL